MKEYGGEQSLFRSTFYLFLRWTWLFGMVYVPLSFIGYELPEISAGVIAILTVSVLTYAFIRQGFCNTTITFEDGKVTFSGIFPLFRNETVYELSQIQSVTMRHEWTETVFGGYPMSSHKIIGHFYGILVLFVLPAFIPSDYKWVRVKTSQGEKTYYCFNLTTDDYDGDETYFEVYNEFKENGIDVKWTENNDPFYETMTEEKETTTANTNYKNRA